MGELAQGKALSMGQGQGSQVPYLGEQAEEEAAEQIEKRKAREMWEGVVRKEEGVLTAAERTRRV